MKKLSFIFALLVLSTQLNWALTESKLDVKFDKTTHDFGKVKKGAKDVKCTFKYTNNGTEMLFITRVVKSCGCTEPEYSKEPLMPGQTAEFKVGYTTTDIVGVFNKKLTVFTNTSSDSVILTIKGEVID